VAEFGTPDNNYDDVLTAVFVGERLPDPNADLIDFDGVVTGGSGKWYTHAHTQRNGVFWAYTLFGLIFSFFALSLYLHNRNVSRSLWHGENPTSCI
jgi:hypothetical protein